MPLKEFWTISLLYILCSGAIWGQKVTINDAVQKYFAKEIGGQKLQPKDVLEIGIYDDGVFHKVVIQGSDSLYTKGLRYELGSVTKLFVAYKIEQSIEEGKFGYETLITDFLNISSLKGVKIKHLLSHHTGLHKFPHIDSHVDSYEEVNQPFKNLSDTYLLSYLQSATVDTSKYVYSHTNFFLLGKLLEKVHNRGLETLLEEEFTEISGLTTIGYDTSNLAEGFTVNNDPPYIEQYGDFGGATGLKSSLEDLYGFMTHYIEKRDDDVVLEEVATNQEYINVSSGWHHIYLLNKHPAIASHVGRTNGHQSFIACIPETKTGVVMLGNSMTNYETFGTDVLKIINQYWKKWKKIK